MFFFCIYKWLNVVYTILYKSNFPCYPEDHPLSLSYGASSEKIANIFVNLLCKIWAPRSAFFTGKQMHLWRAIGVQIMTWNHLLLKLWLESTWSKSVTSQIYNCEWDNYDIIITGKHLTVTMHVRPLRRRCQPVTSLAARYWVAAPDKGCIRGNCNTLERVIFG